jgi:hypothetical protein
MSLKTSTAGIGRSPGFGVTRWWPGEIRQPVSGESGSGKNRNECGRNEATLWSKTQGLHARSKRLTLRQLCGRLAERWSAELRKSSNGSGWNPPSASQLAGAKACSAAVS